MNGKDVSIIQSYAKDIVCAFISAGVIKDSKEAVSEWESLTNSGGNILYKLHRKLESARRE